jgi:hypothetical protein
MVFIAFMVLHGFVHGFMVSWFHQNFMDFIDSWICSWFFMVFMSWLPLQPAIPPVRILGPHAGIQVHTLFRIHVQACTPLQLAVKLLSFTSGYVITAQQQLQKWVHFELQLCR